VNPKILTLVVCLFIAAAVPMLAGVPSITIDIPAKAFDSASHGAVLLVHARWCDPGFPNSIAGIADGVVNGKRQTLPLRIVPTSHEDVYAIHPQWPPDGIWVLTITANEHTSVSSVVTLNRKGSVGKDSVITLSRKATDADVIAALHAIR
jgi:hypothetical protein